MMIGISNGITAGALVSSGDYGLTVLAAADKWIDAESSIITTVDATTPAVRGGFTSAFGGLTLADITGPDGELGVKITEDGTTTPRALWASGLCTNLSWGYVKIRARVKYYPQAQAKAWYGPGLRVLTGYTGNGQPKDPATMTPATEVVYRYLTLYRLLSYSDTQYSGDWRDLVFETRISDFSAAETNLTRDLGWRQAGSVAGASLDILELASISVEQKRASDIKDKRDSGVSAFTQATNNQRLVLADDIWLGDTPALMESQAGQLKLTDATTPRTVLKTAHFNNLIPATAGVAIKIGDVELRVGTGSTWRIVQGGTDVDTGYRVAPVPVCVGLVCRASTVELWIDGALQHTEALTMGSSGMQVLGGTAEGSVRSVATFAAALSASEIAAASATMRSQAHLPASWPLAAFSGQSNMVHDSNEAGAQLMAGIRQMPGYAFKRADDGLTAFAWRTGAPLNYISASENYSAGPAMGWFRAAQAAGEPAVVVTCAKGGASATQWLDGGAMYTKCRTEIDAAIAGFGTPLVYVDSWVWAQGEYEASNGAGTYLADLRAIRDWVRAKWGSQVKWVGLTLSANVDPGSAPHAATVRAVQAAFDGEDAGTIYAAHGATLVDAFHYDFQGQVDFGEALYVARQTI